VGVKRRRVSVNLKTTYFIFNSMTQEELQKITQEIESATSPVGIDAKKTHTIIIHKLNQIEQRLARLEANK